MSPERRHSFTMARTSLIVFTICIWCKFFLLGIEGIEGIEEIDLRPSPSDL